MQMGLTGGVGVDVVSISRVKKAVDRCGERFLRRIFTERELGYCLGFGDAYARLAARFAAKEAVFKALGCVYRDRLRWKDIEIEVDGLRGAGLVINDVLRKLFDEMGAKGVLISMSHDMTGDVAVAVAVLIK